MKKQKRRTWRESGIQVSGEAADDEIRCHTEGYRGIQMPDEARLSSYEEMPQTLSHCLQFFLSNFENFKFCILHSMYKISSLPHPIFCFRYR